LAGIADLSDAEIKVYGSRGCHEGLIRARRLADVLVTEMFAEQYKEKLVAENAQLLPNGVA
jgi:hypothetical protein